MSTNMDQQEGFHISNILKLSGKLKPYFPRMIVTVFSGIMNHFLAISVFVMSGYIVGQALVGTLNEKIIPLLIALILLVILRTVFYYSEMWLAHEIAFRVLADFRIKILSSIERVSPSILLGMRSGQLASTLMNDVELLEWFFAHSFGSTIVAFIVTFVILIGLGFFHIAIPLVMLVFLAILFSIPLIMHKKASQQGRLVRDDLADANSVTIEGVQGLREILMLNYVDAYRKINKKSMQKMYDSQLKYGKRLGTEGALLQLVSGLSMIVVLGLTAHLVISGQLDFAWYTVVVILAGMAFNPVIELCNTVRNFGLIFAAANRVFKVIEAKTPVEDNGKNIDVDSLQKDISFDNVYFRYNDDANHALNGVSFTVEQGETVALVGSSGAGKTTCTNLLLRYWDVESGSIRIGGHDIRGMSLDNLRNLTSAVLQDVFLFHGTLKENILLGNPDASEEEMIQAAKAALIHDFIVSLPQGYETMAGERGLRLSGGQRQRIAIARAILKGSPILILDEAVSSLDAENEAEIQKVLDQSRDRRTTLIVAHRLSTIMSADKLVVLKDGGVVQVGTHDELMKSDGFYKSLIETQLHLEVTL